MLPRPMPFASSTHAWIKLKAPLVALLVWVSTVAQAQVAPDVDPPAKRPPITILLPGGRPPKELPPPMNGPPCERTGCTAEELDAWYGIAPQPVSPASAPPASAERVPRR